MNRLVPLAPAFAQILPSGLLFWISQRTVTAINP